MSELSFTIQNLVLELQRIADGLCSHVPRLQRTGGDFSELVAESILF